MDRSVVVVALLGLLIAAEIDPDEPPSVASCDDLSNFASHRDFLLGAQREAHTACTLNACWSQYSSADWKEAG